jgi:Vanadium chloroperoxidase N-terminal domain
MAPNEAFSTVKAAASAAASIAEAISPSPIERDIILYWNAVAIEANRESHSVPNGEQTGPTLSARALGIVHLAMHDAYFAIVGGQVPYMSLPKDPLGIPVPPGNNKDAAVSAAACTALSALYPSQRAKFETAVLGAEIPAAGAGVSGAFGRVVGHQIFAKLAIKPQDPGVGDKEYEASFAQCHHRQDPDNPGQGFYGPFYGTTARSMAVTKDHALAPPPISNTAEYRAALDHVIKKGGATALKTTDRASQETLIGIYWAYDGVKSIGTPPRLYNQILRTVARTKNNTEAANARLFALVNVAMADAGKFCWREKYKYDLWRPVLGVREHDPSMGPTATPAGTLDTLCHPFWLPLGAPKTNEPGGRSFSPNFPAYPSGHATFGASALQMIRRFYGNFTPAEIAAGAQTPDTIAFDFVSDELNGISVDAGGTVRPRHERRFDSLWSAIYENGLSRVFLGVHWIYDAFDAADVQNTNGSPKKPAEIRYTKQVGGVKLGLDIANDIFDHGLKASTP